ncbi:MAG: protein translocase subunit SecF [bacterium]
MQINYLKHKGLYFTISGLLITASLFSIFYFGLLPGIDFTGGSIMEIVFIQERPENAEVNALLAELNLGELYLQPTGENGLILRMPDISETTHQSIFNKIGESWEIEELRFESIGPVIGRELKEKTKMVIVISLIAIVSYIALAFRRLTFPAKSWQYGIASLFALFHDVLIPLGVFSLLGKFYGVQITIPVIVALLTVLGYSINNTVVVFDRIRENLIKREGKDYQDTVNISLNQTLSRSVSTSLTTLFVLTSIYLFGGETLKYFSLAMIIGLIAGTYSSFFLVSPLLVVWLKFRKKIY